MQSSSKNIDLAVYNVNKDLKSIRNWFCSNYLIYNTKRSEAIIIASPKALKTIRDIKIFYRYLPFPIYPFPFKAETYSHLK